MNIALCLYGFLRTFDSTAPYIKRHIIQPTNADIFCYTPSTYKPLPASDLYWNDERPIAVNKSGLISALGRTPKRLDIWNYDETIFHRAVKEHGFPEVSILADGTVKQPVWRMLSMFHHISQCMRLKKNSGKKYDAVIMTRPDILPVTNIDISGLNPKNLAYYPSSFEYTPEGKKLYGAAAAFGLDTHINDQIIIMSDQDAETFADIYDRIPQYVAAGCALNNETLMAYHFIQNKISFAAADFITYKLQRDELTQTDIQLIRQIYPRQQGPAERLLRRYLPSPLKKMVKKTLRLETY